jgi:hypothetical protein
MQIFARSFAAFALSVLNAMADQRLTAELCTAIASAMNDGDRGARSRWVSMKQMLIDANLAHFAQLHPSMLLCHNDNRGGYGLNAFNSHLLGWKIGKVGADLQELLHACCIELSANADVRKEQVEFNKRLVQSSGGLLSPVLGNEKYLSLSCGHTVGLARAINANCVTTLPALKALVQDGQLTVKGVCGSDAVYTDMVTSGWQWLVIDQIVED